MTVVDCGASVSRRLMHGHRNRDDYSHLGLRFHLHGAVLHLHVSLREKEYVMGGELPAEEPNGVDSVVLGKGR